MKDNEDKKKRRKKAFWDSIMHRVLLVLQEIMRFTVMCFSKKKKKVSPGLVDEEAKKWTPLYAGFFI